ncbi:MAG: hypothetical protein DRP09_18600 [Candidatus Thorarchaeota archaeon]|nr:MAG: hypothetical protein DRP09_18600 [Candidatus Thorarchaeota archaeon]
MYNEGKLKRRVVRLISEYLEPRQIFKLITQREWPYSALYQKEYACRDRAMMSLAFCSAGRIAAVVGGDRYKLVNGVPVRVGSYEGLKRENLILYDDYIMVRHMVVVKRSWKVVEKYGAQIQVRDDFIIPLKRGLFENPYWDQLVPFGWLILEYLENCAPEKGRLFPYKTKRAWQIVNYVTGMFPNWFRAQAEHFYGHYLLPDSVKLAKFVKVVRPEQVSHYIGYSWQEQLKNKELKVDFGWIEKEVREIKKRMKEEGIKV